VSAFADTSFLCALYHTQPGTERADGYMQARGGAVDITSMVRFEFLQGTRLEAWRHDIRRTTAGYSLGEALALQLRFDEELRAGRVRILAPDWELVFREAEMISERHTAAKGYRGFDILHLASAKSLGFTEFLTFDAAQRTMAEAEGLVVPL